jgi:hypothetical protein
LGPLTRVHWAMPEVTLCLAVGQLQGGARHAAVSHHRSRSGPCEGFAHGYRKKGPSGLKTNFFGVPRTQGCALGYRKPALQA